MKSLHNMPHVFRSTVFCSVPFAMIPACLQAMESLGGRGSAQCGLGVAGGSDQNECTSPVINFTSTFVIYMNSFRSKKTLFLSYF